MEWSRLLEVSRFKFQDSTQLSPLAFTSQSADSPSGFATNHPNGILVRERGDSKGRRHLSCREYPCVCFCYGHRACLREEGHGRYGHKGRGCRADSHPPPSHGYAWTESRFRQYVYSRNTTCCYPPWNADQRRHNRQSSAYGLWDILPRIVCGRYRAGRRQSAYCTPFGLCAPLH